MIDTLGHKIRKVRELKDLTQEHLAEELGISQQAYSKLERGDTEVSLESAEKIANILGVSLTDLMAFDERVVFNVHNNQTEVINNFLNQNNIESKAMQEKVGALEKEVAYLKEIIGLLRGK